MTTSESRPEREDPLNWRNAIYFVVFICVVVLFANDKPLAAVRLIGLSMLVESVLFFINPKIPYGWEGEPPLGHITGVLARVLSIVLFSFGVALVWKPDFGLMLLRWS